MIRISASFLLVSALLSAKPEEPHCASIRFDISAYSTVHLKDSKDVSKLIEVTEEFYRARAISKSSALTVGIKNSIKLQQADATLNKEMLELSIEQIHEIINDDLQDIFEEKDIWMIKYCHQDAEFAEMFLSLYANQFEILFSEMIERDGGLVTELKLLKSEE